ncbi:hypothetical protein Cgig2_032123 [Carnegiea gigantea]|uniref:Uncharacterized protein n=1 Tax=Carnegiea gigantea TaxID=171969 RepID=A0A9Q1JSU2_9CARY|nr:hypothetical protein Cgig2_032123 [Carnegiea gigantea]
MGFPCSLTTGEMALYVLGVGSWRPVDNRRCPATRMRRRVQDLMAKPPLPVMIARDEARLVVTAYTLARWPCRLSLSWGAYRSDICIRYLVPPCHVEKAKWCPNAGEEEVACDFDLPEMVQATFYAMLLNDVVGLSIARGFIVTDSFGEGVPVGMLEVCDLAVVTENHALYEGDSGCVHVLNSAQSALPFRDSSLGTRGLLLPFKPSNSSRVCRIRH